MSHQQHLCTNNKGFSLIELMVGMVVAGIVMTMAYQFFINQVNISSTELRVSNLQMNTQSVFRYMTDQLRNAGYGVTTKVPIAPIVIYDSDERFLDDGGNPNVNDTSFFDDMKEGTDKITILRSSDSFNEMTIDRYQPPSQVIKIQEPNAFTDYFATHGDQGGGIVSNPFENGLMLVFKDNEYQLVLITNVENDPANPVTNVTINPGWGGTVNSNEGLGYNYTGGKAIFLGQAGASFNGIYVDVNNILRLDAGDSDLPLLDNVVNLQIVSGLDTDADGIVDLWVEKPASNQKPFLKAVRMYIYAMTGENESRNIITKIPPGIDDYDPSDPATDAELKDADGNYRSVLRQYMIEVNCRNLFPIGF